jgi:hypothetical protein
MVNEAYLIQVMKVTDCQPKGEKSRSHGQRRITGGSDEICLFSSEAMCTGAITRGSVI